MTQDNGAGAKGPSDKAPTGADWKRQMKEMMEGLTGGVGKKHSNPPGVSPEDLQRIGKALEDAPGVLGVTGHGIEVTGLGEAPAGSLGSLGAKLTQRSEAKLYDLEGQDLSGFPVGSLVELVPTVENPHMLPYLPTTKRVGVNNRSEMYRLDGVKRGMVVRRGWKDTRKVFEESSSNVNNRQADEMLRKLEDRGVVHGRAELLEVLIGEDEVIVEVLGPSCDTVRSFMVRNLEGSEESDEDEGQRG